METEGLVLPGTHVRLEALDHRHIEGVVAAAAADPSHYRWSSVPQGKVEVSDYVETALAWRDAGSAVPFAIVQVDAGRVIGSTRFWNLERWSWPQGHARQTRHVLDACEIGYTWLTRSAIRTAVNTEAKAAHADACLRNVAGAPRLLSHRRAQPAFTHRARTHRWKV